MEAGLRESAWRLLLGACRNSGAAFIKWGQWAATRQDLFPPDFCHVLSELHDRAPVHVMEHSRHEIEAAFGRRVDELFEEFEEKPVASGSIAQVHRAKMRWQGEVREVAVKVRHPGVARRIWQDFQILKPLASASSRVRALKGLSLKESVSNFSHTMTAQADLRVEAVHLQQFYNNFSSVTSQITTPWPFPGLATEGVLVETFEHGRSVAHYINNPEPVNTQIVGLGVDAYLKMLLQDNFVHTDLHPGNIMVKEPDGNDNRLKLILLDFGLAEELTPTVRYHFISFLNSISKGDGKRATRHLLQWSSRQECEDPAAFEAEMIEMFRKEANIFSEKGVDLDGVIKNVLRLARKHSVTIDSSYAALVIGVCVIVGFAISLDPDVNLMDAATPCLFAFNLSGRVIGRLYG